MTNVNVVNQFRVRELLLALLVTLALSACSEKIEQSISFYDEYIEQNVLEGLQAEGIPFRQEDETIWYSANHRDAVLAIYQKVVARRPIQYGFYDLEARKHFQLLLSEMNIVAKSGPDRELMYVVSVPTQYRDRAEETFQQMLRTPEK